MATKDRKTTLAKCLSGLLALTVISQMSLAKQAVSFEKLDKPRVIVLTATIGSSIGKREITMAQSRSAAAMPKRQVSPLRP